MGGVRKPPRRHHRQVPVEIDRPLIADMPRVPRTTGVGGVNQTAAAARSHGVAASMAARALRVGSYSMSRRLSAGGACGNARWQVGVPKGYMNNLVL